MTHFRVSKLIIYNVTFYFSQTSKHLCNAHTGQRNQGSSGSIRKVSDSELNDCVTYRSLNEFFITVERSNGLRWNCQAADKHSTDILILLRTTLIKCGYKIPCTKPPQNID